MPKTRKLKLPFLLKTICWEKQYLVVNKLVILKEIGDLSSTFFRSESVTQEVNVVFEEVFLISHPLPTPVNTDNASSSECLLIFLSVQELKHHKFCVKIFFYNTGGFCWLVCNTAVKLSVLEHSCWRYKTRCRSAI